MFPRVREAQLFTYAIASSELRYSAVHERTIFLRSDPDPIVRGEICDSGSDCYANLSQVLLEYAMSCECCQDEAPGEYGGRCIAHAFSCDSLLQRAKHP